MKSLPYVFFALVFLIYFYLRTMPLLLLDWSPKIYGDTHSYVSVSFFPIFSKEFFLGIRALVVPLIYKIFNRNFNNVVFFQTIFSSFSWFYLSVIIYRSLNNKFLKILGAAIILGFSMSQYIDGWNIVMLSESVMLSLTAILIGLYFSFIRSESILKSIGIILVSYLWVFTRDGNAYILLFFAVSILCILFITKNILNYKKYLIMSCSFVLIFMVSSYSANIGLRYLVPFQNIVGQRILPDKEATDFFLARGMPGDASVFRYRYDYAGAYGDDLFTDPAMNDYREWVRLSGKTTYLKYLIFNLGSSIALSMNDMINTLNLFPHFHYVTENDLPPKLPESLQVIFHPVKLGSLLLPVTFMVFGIHLGMKSWEIKNTNIIPLVLLIAVPFIQFLSWHADAMEIIRHGFIGHVFFYLSFWLLSLTLIDSLLDREKTILD